MSRPSPKPLQSTPILTALEQSDALAGLLQIQRQSALYLQTIQPLLPAGLDAHVKAGPIDEEGWCLLVQHNAAGSKLRQLLPAISAHLRTKGYPVQHIRVKVMRQV